MTKNKINPVITFLFIFLIFSITVLAYFGTKFNIFGQGFTVISTSLSNFIPNDPNAESNALWLINLKFNNFGQSISGIIDNKKISDNGIIAKYDLKITGNLPKQIAQYIIDNTNPQGNEISIYNIQTKIGEIRANKFFGIVTSYTVTEPETCPKGSKYVIKINVGPELGVPSSEGFSLFNKVKVNGGTVVTASRICVIENIKGVYSNINPSPNVISKVNLNVEAKGESYSGTITPNERFVDLGPYVKAQFVGDPLRASLQGNLDVGGSYVAISERNTLSWKLASKGKLNNYLSAKSSADNKLNILSTTQDHSACFQSITNEFAKTNDIPTVQTVLNKWTECVKNDLNNNYITPMNVKAMDLLNSNDEIIILGNSLPANYDGKNKFNVILSDMFPVEPEILLRVKASWIGINIPSGTPEIVSVNSIKFSPADLGSDEAIYNIKVKNIGSSTGYFQATLKECTNDYISQTSSEILSLNSGEVGIIKLPVISLGAKNVDGECTLKVSDVNSGDSDTVRVAFTILEANACNLRDENKLYYPGTGNVIYRKVTKNGVCQLVEEFTCEFGVTRKSLDSNWECAEQLSGDTIFCERKGKNVPAEIWDREICEKKKGFSVSLPIIFSALAGVLTLSVSSIPSFRDKNPGFLAIGLVAGGIVGFVIYYILINITKILVGSVVLGLAGGLFVWIFGPILIIIAGIIGAIISSFSRGMKKR